MQPSLFKSFVQITVNLQYLYWNVYCITFYIFMIIFKTHNTVHLQKCAKFFSTSISQWDSLVFQISKRISTSIFYFWQNWLNATEPVPEFCANHCSFAKVCKRFLHVNIAIRFFSFLFLALVFQNSKRISTSKFELAPAAEHCASYLRLLRNFPIL